MIVPIRKFVQVEEPNRGMFDTDCERVKVLSVSLGIEDIKVNDIIICRNHSIENTGKFYFVDYNDIFAIDKD
jgi:hypothetical protein